MKSPLIARWILSFGVIGIAASSAGVVSAQEYPTKPIRLVSSNVGSATDFVSRVIAHGISGTLGQQVIVDNRTDQIGHEIVLKAAPDGYTLRITGTGFWVEPLLRKLAYDPVKDFLPITLATMSPNILVIGPTFPAKSVKELIAIAKAKPGALSYASAGFGGSAHLAGELFKSMAGVNILHVPYKGSGPGLTNLVGGETQLMFATAGSATPLIKSGKLTALAVTSAQPSALLPGLPTIAAAGVPGYESVSMVGVFGPSKTPAALINRLNREMVQVLNSAAAKEQLFNAGVEVVASSPEQLAAKVKSEVARLGKVIKDAGIRSE